ncbi:hypothetical protein ACRRTK_005393 [Alexandromys fortis]
MSDPYTCKDHLAASSMGMFMKFVTGPPQRDITKDECSLLKLQLKERDELISQLQAELHSSFDWCKIPERKTKGAYGQIPTLKIQSSYVFIPDIPLSGNTSWLLMAMMC